MAQSVFHSTCGGFDFLGMRKTRGGGVEIVYDDGVARHMVWRVQGAVSEGALGDALEAAVGAVRVIPTLYAELKRRSISIEVIAH
jgi:hypothetical protein